MDLEALPGILLVVAGGGGGGGGGGRDRHRSPKYGCRDDHKQNSRRDRSTHRDWSSDSVFQSRDSGRPSGSDSGTQALLPGLRVREHR